MKTYQLSEIELQNIADKLGCTEKLTVEFLRRALANAQLFDKKQHDYGSGNIAEFGTFGCVVRSSDKFKRISNLFRSGGGARVFESLTDNFQDISNYMIISQMCDEGAWPGVPKAKTS